MKQLFADHCENSGADTKKKLGNMKPVVRTVRQPDLPCPKNTDQGLYLWSQHHRHLKWPMYTQVLSNEEKNSVGRLHGLLVS